MGIDCQPPAVTVSAGRLVSTFGATIYFQLTTIVVQLLLVPILLHFWGTEQYGVWLLLSAVPTYLSFADFGFTAAAKNEMMIKVARGAQSGALTTYQSVFVLLTSIAVLVLLGIAAGLSKVDLHHLFFLGPIGETTAKTILFLFAGNVLLGQYMGLFAAGLRCAGRPAEEVVWGASARLCEGLATTAAASVGGDLITAAVAIVASRGVINLAAWWRLRHLAPWLNLGLTQASRAEIQRLFHPSLSFMLVSISHALMIQGPVVILGLIGTPLQVVIFSTSRTLARLGTSAANMFHNTFMPEYSRLFGADNGHAFARLIRVHLGINLMITAAYIGGLSMIGDWILRIWTHGQVTAEWPFFTIVLFAVAAEMIWTTLLIPLASVNRHTLIGYIFTPLAVTALIASYFLGRQGGLTGLTVPLLAIHTMMILIVGTHLGKLRSRFLWK
jgi:O-antigen/teichoic acid export membrane protein